MTTAFAVGAASHEPRNWHAVDWRAATGNVRRLQVRIAKAVKEGRWVKETSRGAHVYVCSAASCLLCA